MTAVIPEAIAPDLAPAPANAVEAVDEHTPATPAPDPVPDGIADLRETVGELATAVATLTATVTDMVAGSHGQDESPTSVPWTHRGGHRGDES